MKGADKSPMKISLCNSFKNICNNSLPKVEKNDGNDQDYSRMDTCLSKPENCRKLSYYKGNKILVNKGQYSNGNNTVNYTYNPYKSINLTVTKIFKHLFFSTYICWCIDIIKIIMYAYFIIDFFNI